ncbi:hypothetical protein VPH35_040726 [Triticum aestivum]|uniref:inorganic diphosphatase n=1 Tax=Aegilops tauschii subsp. strangulata TaxID=200361 RepID=A0A453DB39_AEGTS
MHFQEHTTASCAGFLLKKSQELSICYSCDHLVNLYLIRGGLLGRAGNILSTMEKTGCAPNSQLQNRVVLERTGFILWQRVNADIPKGSKVKYEVNKKMGLIKVDCVLYSSVSYRTTTASSLKPCDDSDPIDFLVIMH